MERTFRAIGVERLRLVNDGEGVTTLVAGHDCPLRCKYCLNPQCFALSAPKTVYTVQELLDQVRIDDLYFQATGGGIVFGGGEPLLQAEFIHAFCSAAPPEWKIGLETSLAVSQSALLQVIDDIDFYLADIKDMNPEIYHRYTGAGNQQVIENLRFLQERGMGERVTIRLPLIEGFNTESDRQASKKQLQALGFQNFDFFRYNLQVSQKKLDRIRGI